MRSRTRRQIARAALIVCSAALVSGCISIKPQTHDDALATSAWNVDRELKKCPAHLSYLCTDRIVCGAEFPAIEQRTTLNFGPVAGFDGLSAVIEPEGYVSEVRRYKRKGEVLWRQATACSANLVTANL